MGISLSEYGANTILEVLLNKTTMPTSLWIALSRQQIDPVWDGDDLAFYEPDDPAYARIEIPLDAGFTDPEGGVSANTDTYQWDTPSEDWGQIGFFALLTEETSGEVFYIGDLASPFYVAMNGEVSLDAGTINLTVASLTDYGTDS